MYCGVAQENVQIRFSAPLNNWSGHKLFICNNVCSSSRVSIDFNLWCQLGLHIIYCCHAM